MSVTSNCGPPGDARPAMIVAQVTVNYPRQDDVTVAGRFERVLIENARRGYRLHSWRMSSVACTAASSLGTPVGQIVDQIVAVFELDLDGSPNTASHEISPESRRGLTAAAEVHAQKERFDERASGAARLLDRGAV
jgi:hypothetical protein